jgi:hypothetical protein
MSKVETDERTKDRIFSRCRIAWLDGGVEGWSFWRAISEYERLRQAAAELMRGNQGVRAWVERR